MLQVGKRSGCFGFLNLLYDTYFCLFSVTVLPFSEPVSPSADKGCSNQSRSPVAASQSAVLHAPPADEQDSGRGRSPDAASGVGKSERKSRSRSKEGQKTETGAAVAPPAPDASGGKAHWLFKSSVFLPFFGNVFPFLRACFSIT